MKAEKAKSGFQPITLTIESQVELDWIRAISNTGLADAKESAGTIGFKISGTDREICEAQMSLYNLLEDLSK